MAIVGPFSCIKCTMELSMNTVVPLLVCNVINHSNGKNLQSSVFRTPLKKVVQKCVAEPHIEDALGTKNIDVPTVTVPLPKFSKTEPY